MLAPIECGHLITRFAGAGNIADSNLVNSNDVKLRVEAIRRAYVAPYETEAQGIFDKYNVKYIMVNPRILKQYNISGLSYTDDKKCFQKVYSSATSIYEVKCRLQNI